MQKISRQWGTQRSAGVRRVAVVLALLVVAFGAEAPPTEREKEIEGWLVAGNPLTHDKLGPTVGRFQLVALEYESTMPKTVVSIKTVFRIDTATGRAWYMASGIRSNVLHEYWSEVPEFAEWRKSQKP